MRSVALYLSLLAAPAPRAGAQPAGWQRIWSGEPLPGGIESYAVTADGRCAATRGEDGRVILWDLATGAVLRRLEGAGSHGALLAFSPDGELLACQVPHWQPPPGLRVFRVADGRELHGWQHVPLGPGSERGDGDGRRWREGAELWLHQDGATVFHPGDYQHLLVSSTRALTAAAPVADQRWRVSAAGDQVAVFTVSGLQGGPVPEGKQRNTLALRVFAVADGREHGVLEWARDQERDQLHPVAACTFDFRELALVVDGVVVVLAFPGGQELQRFGQGVTALQQDGARRFTGHRDGSVVCWQGPRALWRSAALAQPVAWLTGRGDEVLAGGSHTGVAALRGGKRWLLDPDAGEAQSSGVWTVVRDRGQIQAYRDGAKACSWRGSDHRDGSYYGSRDQRTVPVVIARDRLVFRGDGGLRVLDLPSGRTLAPPAGHTAVVRVVEWGPVAADPTATRLLVKDWHQTVELRADGASQGPPVGGAHVHWAGAERVVFAELMAGAPWRVATADDGTCAWRDGERVRVLRAADRAELLALPPAGQAGDPLALSADGRLLASVDGDARTARLTVRTVRDGRILCARTLPVRTVELLAFAPAGDALVVRSGFRNQLLALPGGDVCWEFDSGPATMGEDLDCRSFAWSGDGRTLWATSHGGANLAFDRSRGRAVELQDTPQDAYSHFAQLLAAPRGRVRATQHPERDLVYLWPAAAGAAPVRIRTPVAAHTTAFLPDATALVATRDGLLSFAPDTLAPLPVAVAAPCTQVFVAPGGRLLALSLGARLSLYRR